MVKQSDSEISEYISFVDVDIKQREKELRLQASVKEFKGNEIIIESNWMFIRTFIIFHSLDSELSNRESILNKKDEYQNEW